ncbi:MAG: hypothetical protein Q4G00_00050 [Clostridia bacterium]|nr:hypothetical protein [Clostridia bacterium]
MVFPGEHKEYVKVRADFMPDGRILPLMFKTEDGQKTIIDRILDVRQAPALKAGGQGVRYTCRIGDQVIYLFHDRDYWFLEET